jgi:hypothetical protein
MSNVTSPNKIVEDTNSDGIVTSYKCDYHIQTGAIASSNGKTINSYYEMLLPCQENPDNAMAVIASELLDSLGMRFGLLPDGSACTIPDTTLNVWVIGETSSPLDSIVPHMGCTKLTTGDNAELCCVVVKAPMTFWVSSTNFKDQDVMKYVASELDAGNFTYQTTYIGSILQFTGNAGAGQIPSQSSPHDDQVIAGISQTPTSSKSGKSSITVTGGLLMSALIVVVVFGIGLITFRRRRHVRKAALDEESIDKNSLDFTKNDDSAGPALHVEEASHEMLHRRAIFTNNSFGLDDKMDDPEDQRNYTFDIADNMKNHIMGQYGGHGNYGPTSMAVYPPYQMEETSDSEADSWAQTEGTVGSLEENLEQITAEI